jgi:hypothetical protein
MLLLSQFPGSLARWLATVMADGVVIVNVIFLMMK